MLRYMAERRRSTCAAGPGLRRGYTAPRDRNGRRTAEPTVLAALLLAVAPGGVIGQSEPNAPLAFLEPLIGTWVGAPGWLADDPGMDAMIPIAFRWGPGRHSILEQSGLPQAGRLFTVGLIAWDPIDRRVEFTSSQGSDQLLFTGHYRVLDGGEIQRTYTVRYPDATSVDFRETFFFDGPDSLDWLTEWRVDGQWVPRRGDGQPEFRALRRAVAGDEAVRALGPWIGRWAAPNGDVVDVAATGSAALSLTVTPVSGSVTEGLLYLDPHDGLLRATSVSGAGGVLRAGIVVREASSRESGSIEWHVEHFAPDGSIDRWLETWVRAGSDCFTRSRTTRSEAERTNDVSLCRG